METCKPEMSADEAYYLGAILRQLKEFRSVLPEESMLSLGSEALADNIDWLDCYIARFYPNETLKKGK